MPYQDGTGRDRTGQAGPGREVEDLRKAGVGIAGALESWESERAVLP